MPYVYNLTIRLVVKANSISARANETEFSGSDLNRSYICPLKGLAQAKIIKKSVILFWLLNMTIWCKHVHRLELQKCFNLCAAHSPVRLDIETKFLISNYWQPCQKLEITDFFMIFAWASPFKWQGWSSNLQSPASVSRHEHKPLHHHDQTWIKECADTKIVMIGVKRIGVVHTRTMCRSMVSEPSIYRPLGYERVYLSLCKVADTPFHIQGDDIYNIKQQGGFQRKQLRYIQNKTSIWTHSVQGPSITAMK